MKISWLPVGMLFLILIAGACRKSEYRRMVERELASGERNDSLFLGFYFGMPADEFYDHCWELNRREMVKQGPENASVQYNLDEFKAPARMNFYPDFHENRIYEMPVLFEYQGWAPWNKEFFSDALIEEVIALLEEWYGQGFVEIRHPEKEDLSVFVKIDGNRQIRVTRHSDRYVKAIFTDLTVEEKSKK